ncbi:MAG: alpha/beta hydrolase [Phormidesmis sp.]
MKNLFCQFLPNQGLSHRPSVLSRRTGFLTGFLASAIAAFPAALPAQSAERIQFFFGPFEPTIYVDDLETFATTGEVPERFEIVANRLNDQQKSQLRAALNAHSELSPIPISQFTYSPFGENLLDKLGQVIQTDSFLNGMKGIRAALILAASDEANGGFSTLNVLRHFPTDTIQIDFSLARQIVAENERIYSDRDRVIAEIKQTAQAQAIVPMSKANLAADKNPMSAGPYTWTTQTITFQTPGRPQSSLADLYLPQASSAAAETNAVPVVVISHGVASSRKTFQYMAEHLASHGYGVVSLEHVDTSAEKFVRFLWGKEGPPSPQDLLLRPQDITAALDFLTQQQASDPALARLSLSSVGVLGQSLGGYTVLAAGGAEIDPLFLGQECESSLAERPSLNISLLLQCTLLELPANTPLEVADERVGAIISLNPLTSSIFGRSGLQKIDVPVMLMAGTNDFVTPALPEQIEPFDWLEAPHKTLVVMENGTHFSFLDRETRSVLPFSDGLTGPDPLQARGATQALSLAFFNRHLLNDSEADAFLNQAYLNEWPTGPFEFSLVTESSVINAAGINESDINTGK